MDSLNKSLGKVSIGVPSKPSIFTFVPVVHKLPFKSNITEEERSGALTGKPNKNVAVSHERATGETMSDGETFKAERVFIRDSVEVGAGNIIQPETELQSMPSLDHVSPSHTKASPSVSTHSENTLNHAAAGTASMETAADKHRSISQWRCHDTSGRAEVSSGCFANRASVSEDRMSPTNSADLFPTLASSRESILSEGSDKDKSVPLSSVTSPSSFSRNISPCSSVRSGVFSPSVTQMRRHFLAPASSLVHIPQTCFSSCESLFSSVCPQSPPPPRHRPPLTRLSLLTAILRKGRLPVLSSALQRPYTPCWPVNPVTLSFCNACSAASSVASIPLEFSSRFPSSVSIDSQSHVHREPNRCVISPPPVHSNELNRTRPQTQVKRCSEKINSSSAPRSEQVISPPPVKNNTLPRVPLPLFCSNFKSVSPAKQEEIMDYAPSKKLQHTHTSISKGPELKTSNKHMSLRGHADDNLKKLSPELLNEQESSRPQISSHLQNSSLSKLHSLSEKLRSAPAYPPQQQPSQSRSPNVAIFPARTDSASPLPPVQKITGRCESERSCPASKTATPTQGFHKAHCLSPSRYTPITFPGWASPTSSPTPTPSPAPAIRDLTPSPSLSLRSTTPSSRPESRISDCSYREGKKRKTHKIKLSYKSLAAIPTNTLLLDQQAIDEQVEREDSPCDTLDRGFTLDKGFVDTHAEMCSPAQLRQQSEELYAVIDEILANSSPAPSRSSTPSVGVQQNNSSFPKSLGRETKYASLCSLHPPTSVERKLMDQRKTKPGVIRPMTAIPRLRVEDEEEFRPNPFRHTLPDNKKVENVSSEKAGKDIFTASKGMTKKEEGRPERRSPFSLCDLQITEPEEQISHPAKDASTSFSPTEGRLEAFETHI